MSAPFLSVKPLGRFNRFCVNRGFLLTTYVPYGIGEISGKRDFLQFCYFFQMETGFFQYLTLSSVDRNFLFITRN